MRILHISDFHLNKTTLNDWKEHLKSAILNKLIKLHSERKFSLIAFTGDLIDIGGKELGGAEKAFIIFQKELITPILTELNMSTDQFLLCPGNHDIVRSLDSERDEAGSKVYFDQEPKITSFIIDAIAKESYDGIKRIEPYKKFEKEFYKDTPNKQQSVFELAFKINIDGKSVGICCLNSSWRCYSKDDYGQILIGEKQLNLNLSFIKDCDIKIALLHHQLDWLSTVEKKTLSSHITKEFELVLTGHVHESLSNSTTGFSGTTFINVAPSGLNDIRSDSRTFSNGFSVIDRDTDGINLSYWRYHHDNKIFVINTDAGDNGELFFPYPTHQSQNDRSIRDTVLNNIKEDHYPTMDTHFIGNKADMGNVTLKDNFIFSPIDQGLSANNDETSALTTIQEITKSSDNLLFFGSQESGKTSLLYRLVQEYVDDYNILKKIPVYLSFPSLGNKDIMSVIKQYLRCSSVHAQKLINEKDIILLVDDLNYKSLLGNQEQIKRLEIFRKETSVQLIACADNEIAGIIPTEHMQSCKIPFVYYFIKGLRAKEIKLLIRHWLPTETGIKFDEHLEKLVNTFYSYSLPNTPMAVSLYLWSLENKDRKPINQAVLMEIYIEILLEKLNTNHIYRDKFDFTNKLQLIAKVAEEMLIVKNLNYSLSYDQFIHVITDYLNKQVGFSFDVEVIKNYLFERKIFVKTSNNFVKFPYRCFFHFFIAKRMQFNSNFRNYMIDADRYHNYPKELDYYTGLTRSDIELFKIIFERFEAAFAETEAIFSDVVIDDYFTIKSYDGKKEEPIARNIEIAKIKDSRPSEEKMEKRYDEQLEKIANPSSISTTDSDFSLDRILLIMCNVLRNSEGIEDLGLKRKAYNAIIKYNISYAILYSQWVVQYVLENEKLPPSIPPYVSLNEILLNLPFHIQSSLNVHLGTAKLSSIVMDKIKEDRSGKSNTKSELESYFSVALYADIQGANFDKVLKGYIKNVHSISVKNYLYYKLRTYYFKRTKPGSDNEAFYLDLIAKLKISTQNLSSRLKSQIVSSLKETKKKLTDSLND